MISSKVQKIITHIKELESKKLSELQGMIDSWRKLISQSTFDDLEMERLDKIRSVGLTCNTFYEPINIFEISNMINAVPYGTYLIKNDNYENYFNNFFKYNSDDISVHLVSQNKLFIYTGGKDGVIRKLNFKYEQIEVLFISKGKITSLALTPCGKYLAFGSLGNSAIISCEDPSDIFYLADRKAKKVSFSSDGEILMHAFENGVKFHRWRIGIIIGFFSSDVQCSAFKTIGKEDYFITESDYVVSLRKLSKLNSVEDKFEVSDTIVSSAFSNSGKYLTCVEDSSTNNFFLVFKLNYKKFEYFGNNDKRNVVKNGILNRNLSIVGKNEVKNKFMRKSMIMDDTFDFIAFIDGKYIQIWETRSNSIIGSRKIEKECKLLGFDESKLFISQDGVLCMWDFYTNRFEEYDWVFEEKYSYNNDKDIKIFNFSITYGNLLVGDDGVVKIYEYDTWTHLYETKKKYSVSAAVLSNDNTYVFIMHSCIVHMIDYVEKVTHFKIDYYLDNPILLLTEDESKLAVFGMDTRCSSLIDINKRKLISYSQEFDTTLDMIDTFLTQRSNILRFKIKFYDFCSED